MDSSLTNGELMAWSTSHIIHLLQSSKDKLEQSISSVNKKTRSSHRKYRSYARRLLWHPPPRIMSMGIEHRMIPLLQPFIKHFSKPRPPSYRFLPSSLRILP